MLSRALADAAGENVVIGSGAFPVTAVGEPALSPGRGRQPGAPGFGFVSVSARGTGPQRGALVEADPG